MERTGKMANQTYYKLNSPSKNNNIVDLSSDIIVNCCGETVIRNEWRHCKLGQRRDYYLLYSLGGDILGTIGEKQVVIRAGNVVCIKNDTPYMFGSRSPMEEWTHYYWIHFTGHDADMLLSRTGIEPNNVYELDQSDEVISFFERLFLEFRTESEHLEYNAALQLKYIMYTFSRARRQRENGRLDRSIRYIHTHLRYDLSIKALAAMEYLGVSRYRQLFHDLTGTSPSEYIARLRIERAKDLLLQTDMSIAEVGCLVGYETRHYFQSIFKHRVGITPGEYRALGGGQ